MASKPVILTVALFVATLVSGTIGYAYYHSYTGIVDSLSSPPTLEEALSRVSHLRYRAVLTNGSIWIVDVTVNHANKSVGVDLLDSNGTLVARYVFGYSNDSIIYAYRLDPKTGNRTGLDVAQVNGPFRTSVRVLRSPAGEVGVDIFPGVGPLYSLYTIGRALSVDWHGQRSPFATVRWGVASYDFNGEKLKAIAISLTIQPVPAPVSEYSSLHAVRAVAAEKGGVVFFPEVSYSAGASELT
nr:hypothetical protein [Desulfurococcales archaeon]